MTDRLPADFTTEAIIKRQVRREFWRCLAVGLFEFAVGVLVLAAMMYGWMLARQ